jgi:hypothetical protein
MSRGRAALGVLCTLAVAACGGSSGNGGSTAAASRTSAAPPAAANVARLGCGVYCQQAGVPQGVTSPGAIVVKILSAGNVVSLADETVPIKVACDAASACAGALVLVLPQSEIPILPTPIPSSEAKLSEGQAGQSDLAVGAHSIRTLGVELVPSVEQMLRSRGELEMEVLAETGPDYAVSDRASILLRAPAQ